MRLFAYESKVHPFLTSLILHSWIAPSLAAYPWTNYLPLFSVILMYTGDSSFIFGAVFLILISWFSGFGLGYGPIVFMLQGRHKEFKPACSMPCN